MSTYSDVQFKLISSAIADGQLLIRQYLAYQYFIDVDLIISRVQKTKKGYSGAMYEGRAELELEAHKMLETKGLLSSDKNQNQQIITDWISSHYVEVPSSEPNINMYVEIAPGFEKIVRSTRRFMSVDTEIKKLTELFDKILKDTTV